MSNSTRPGGYDERLVVPLEASRRGAHRARTNPLVAALPLLAVVVVVAAVIGVTWALFLRGGSDNTASDPLATATPKATAPAGSTPPQPSGDASPSTTPSESPSPSASAPSGGTVSKGTAITVYNGTGISGLARRGANALVAEGFKKATFTSNKWPESVSGTRVFYAKDTQAATAAAVADALGVGKAEKTTDDTGAGIAVVVGTDAKDVIPG